MRLKTFLKGKDLMFNTHAPHIKDNYSKFKKKNDNVKYEK